MKKLLLLLVGLTVLAPLFPSPALSATPPDVFKDSNGNVFIHGTTATALGSSSRYSTSEDLVRTVRAGYCGEVRLSTSTTLPSIGNTWRVGTGASKLRSSLVSITTTADLPRCRGNAFTPALSAAISTAGGYIDNTTAVPRVYLTGSSPGVSYSVTFSDVDTSVALRPNQCNFFRLSNTSSNPLPASLTIGSTGYTVASLTTAAPPLCQRQANGSYLRYIPTTW